MAAVYAILSSIGGEQRFLSKAEFDNRRGRCVLSIDEFVWSPWSKPWGTYEQRYVVDMIGPIPAGHEPPFEGLDGEQRQLGNDLFKLRFSAPSFKDTENSLLIEYECDVAFGLGEGSWGESYLHLYDWGGDGAGMEFWSTQDGVHVSSLTNVRAYAPASRFWTDFRRCYEK